MIIFFPERNDDCSNNARHCAVFVGADSSVKCIPNSLFEKFDKVEQCSKFSLNLTHDDKLFLKELYSRYRGQYYFLLKIAYKIMLYRTQIIRFSPDAIISTSEYSFTSSALTEYCKRNNIKHINVMHGNKNFYIRDSFFVFDSCYVWDKYYVDLFLSLRAERHQFIIEPPYSQRAWTDIQIEKSVDYTYYLQNEDSHTLEKISESLHKLATLGNVIAVRPHPLYSDMDQVNSILGEFDIEDNTAIQIETSVLRTRNAISLNSTVLIQAYNNGITVIIDDVSSPLRYNELKNKTFICLEKEHLLLSAVV